MEYSTWLGGVGGENGLAIAIDGPGNAYVTGVTSSINFPLVDAPQTQLRSVDAFVSKLNPTGSALVYSTFLGGAGSDQGTAIAVNSAGDAYVVGNTSSPDFPLVNPLRPALGGGADAYIAKLGIESDLAISKTASRNPVLVNNNFSFTMTVANNGPSAATGVTVTDQLPAGTTFVSATSSQGSCANNAGTVTCAVGNLAAQGRATITLTVTPTAVNAITNTATVAANERDGNQSNNQASAQVTISNQPSIYGRVTLSNNSPLQGVALNLTGGLTASRQTDNQGFYQFADLQSGGDYTVTPSLNNFSFDPASRGFNALNSDQEANFVATRCTYTLTPMNQSFNAAGGTGSIMVTAPPRCPWTATPSESWIKITSGASGAGNGSVTFSVDPAQAPRSGRITIADQNFSIFQGVNVCDDLKFRSRGFYVFGSPTNVEAADLNGDGLSDLLVTRFGAEFDQALQRSVFPLDIYYSSARGQFSRGPRLLTPGFIDAQIRYVIVADFNGDGLQDIVSGPVADGEARLFTARNANEFNESVNVRMRPVNSFDFPDSARAADLNRDGKIDLIGITNGRILVALNTSTNNGASFATPFAVSFGGQTFRGLTDVNGDGVADLVTSVFLSSVEQLFQVYPGDGFGSFREPINSTIPIRSILTDFGDFNGDARQDLVALAVFSTPQGDRARMAISYGDDAGRFGPPATFDQFETNQFGQQTRLLARDMNNDARPDALLLGQGRLSLFTTDTTGRLASTMELAQINDNNGVLAVGNFDADGKPDFASLDIQRRSFFVHSNRCGESGLAIYGQTLDLNTPIGFSNVTARLSGAMTAVTTTDLGGNYEFSGLSPGDYVVQVERVLTEFNPSSRTLNNLTTDQVVNFSGVRKSTMVSAASFTGTSIAPDSIAAIFGLEMGRNSEAAQSRPLPIALANHRVDVRDSSGVDFSTQLFFFSPNQINLLIPAGAANGPASYRVFSLTGGQEPDTTGTLMVERVAPGLFTANSDGGGVPAGSALRAKPGSAQSFEPLALFDGMKFVPAPIDLGPEGDQVFLILFGTGIRNRSGLTGASATIGGVICEVQFAGAQGGFDGLDQLNVLLPRSLAGRGEADLILTVDGKRANAVRVNIK
ncbi:MAG: FG-GAP-like repeat-containing protein [Acidobacteria bacterium]|nr:FG-GAP-like repeat-containing protein [Acidobacteriota bacterium]